MIKLVIFDMAGTAVNEDNLVYKTITSTLLAEGIPVELPLVFQLGAGKEKTDAIRDIIEAVENNTPSKERVLKIYRAFNENLGAAYDIFPISIFPSVQSLLPVLRSKGIKIAFNTGYASNMANNILQKTGIEIDRDIDVLMTASDVERSRPAPDMILKICEKLDIKPENAIKIGDSQTDIEEGKSAGVKYSIGVTTGAQDRETLQAASPDFIFDDMLELLLLLEAETVTDEVNQ